ncbi:MAG: Flp family type IVb pilin [Alphaproteobacteria bacterium]|nr:Flp family type IVb pilin [Alphaproteobacteria bacterium]
MGATQRLARLSDAASGFAADPHARRFALSALLRDAQGATAIEYAMVAGGISVVILAVVNLLGTNVKSLFDQLPGLF